MVDAEAETTITMNWTDVDGNSVKFGAALAGILRGQRIDSIAPAQVHRD
jgi:hypothetical protein